MKSLVIIIGAFLICSHLNGQTQSEFVVSEDLIFGADELPKNGVVVTDKTLMFFDKSKGAFRAGGLPEPGPFLGLYAWSPDSIGTYSFGAGYATKAKGYASIALGYLSAASEEYSTAIGHRANASGLYSTSLGLYTEARGYSSTAIGNFTIANGEYSTAFGQNTVANGSFSTSIGRSTYSNGHAGTVIGMYNDSLVTRQTLASSLTPLFIVGNGDNSSNRSNALVVRKDGRVGIGTDDPSGLVEVSMNSGLTNTQIAVHEEANDYARINFTNTTGDNYWTVAGLAQANGSDANAKLNFYYNRLGDVLSLSGNGNVAVTGALSKGSGTFKIDHPLDPLNKFLYHSFVESPDMMNVYNGNVILDTNGEAIVEMADWFSALNMEYRYQLTCIGGFAQVYIAEEISDNHFKIAGGSPGLKVSWQVTGIRKDPYAQMNRVQVEEMKPPAERGSYLHPTAYKINDLTVSTDNDVEND